MNLVELQDTEMATLYTQMVDVDTKEEKSSRTNDVARKAIPQPSSSHELVQIKTNQQEIDLRGCIFLDDAFRELQTNSNIRKLNLSGCKLQKKHAEILGTLSSISSLDISATDCTDEMLIYIGRMKLTTLNISNNETITDEGIAQLHRLPLQELYIENLPNMRDRSLTFISKTFTELHTLSVQQNYQLDAFSELVNCKNLLRLNLSKTLIDTRELAKLPKTIQALDVSSCGELAHKKLAFVHLPELQALSIRDTEFEFVFTLEALKQNKKLVQLDISKGYGFRELTLEAVQKLSELSQLTCLHISNALLECETVIALLQKLPNLKQFHFEGFSHHPFLILKEFAEFSQLEVLNLKGHFLTCRETEIPLGTAFVHLQELYFARCKDSMTDVHLSSLGTFENVTVLDLRDCYITTKSLENLAKQFPKLQKLYLGGDRITDQIIACVVQSLPVLPNLILEDCDISDTSAQLLADHAALQTLEPRLSRLSMVAMDILQNKTDVIYHNQPVDPLQGRKLSCIIL